MAKIITDDQHYKNIANAIRESNGETTLYKPSEMADAVRNLSSLNFKVVGGTTQPDDPKENMIWVITPNEITSWIFDTTKPEAPEDGMVWFRMSASSNIDFNALKNENSVHIRPNAAQQYVNGSWEYMVTMYYQNGEWTNGWNGELYEYGNVFDRVTGGYSAQAYTGNANGKAPAVTFNDDSMYISQPGGDNADGRCITNNVIDMSQYNTLYMLYSCTNANTTNANGHLAIDDAFSFDDLTYIAKSPRLVHGEMQTTSIDISNIERGHLCVRFTNYYNTINVTVYKIWME